MVKRYLSTKFGINLLDGFWQNGFYRRQTDDGRRKDGQRITDACMTTAQSKAKNSKFPISQFFKQL